MPVRIAVGQREVSTHLLSSFLHGFCNSVHELSLLLVRNISRQLPHLSLKLLQLFANSLLGCQSFWRQLNLVQKLLFPAAPHAVGQACVTRDNSSGAGMLCSALHCNL